MKSGTRDLRATEIIIHLIVRVRNPFSFLSCSPPSWLYSSLLRLTRASKPQVLICHDSQRQPLIKQHTVNTAVNYSAVFIKALYKVRQLLVCWCGAWGTKTGMGRRTCLRSHQRKQAQHWRNSWVAGQGAVSESRFLPPKPSPPASYRLDPIAHWQTQCLALMVKEIQEEWTICVQREYKTHLPA